MSSTSNLRVPCRSLVLLTANNASLRRDMLRRTLRVRIVVPDEKPELRRFDFDPVEEATRDRRELLTAAFTVLLAWLRVRDRAENKAHRKPLGSFEAWADLVAGAVSWLTGTNPVDLIEESKDQDASTEDERRIIVALAVWQKGLRDKDDVPRSEWTAKEAATEIDSTSWAEVLKFKGEQPSASDVSYWLRKGKDRVFGDYLLTNSLDRKGIARWSLVQVPGMPGMAGDNLHSRARNGEDADSAKSCDGGENIPGNARHPRHVADPGEPSRFKL